LFIIKKGYLIDYIDGGISHCCRPSAPRGDGLTADDM
jgi:hypothetical protein